MCANPCVCVQHAYTYVCETPSYKTSEGVKDSIEGLRCSLSQLGSRWDVNKWETLSYDQGNCGRENPMSHRCKTHHLALQQEERRWFPPNTPQFLKNT